MKSLPTAKKEYKEAMARGETAGFLEQVEEDVFTMKLGNIPAVKGTKVEVDVGYVTELKHDTEVDGIRFTIPTAIAPRYGETSSGARSTSGTSVKNGLEMNIELDMPGPVASVQSPSHPLAVTIGSLNNLRKQDAEFDNKLAFATLTQSNTFLEKDFVLLVICNNSAAPNAMLETHTNANNEVTSAALMLTFVPKFVIPPSPGLKKTRKEIIFMVDRSGSMYDKIDPLRSALRVFLKSLPPNDGIRFDICSFGSRYSFLFDQKREGQKPGSTLYSQKSLQHALDHVEKIAADYGGTEIFAPLKESCERVLRRNKERTERIAAGNAEEEEKAEWETEILLLTDGEVWDTKRLFDLVRDHTQEWRAEGKRADGRAGIRVFTLGIGDDVSHGFVEGLAKAGGGYCMTVGNNERFEGKVVRMLKAALGERVGGFKLTFDGMDKWGASSPETSGTVSSDGDDDFEMVDRPTDTSAQTTSPAPAPTPISLFDNTANPDGDSQTAKASPVTTLIPPVLLRAPHIIPPLFSFNRTTVFLLLSPRTPSSSLPLPQNIVLKAVTSGGQPLELSVPVTKVSESGSKTLHQLATKKYLDDLKVGETWIHSACGSGEQLECIRGEGENAKKGKIKLPSRESDDFNEDEFDDIVKREGERVGVQWGVVGKWTAFVALEETSAEQKVVEEAAAISQPPAPAPIGGAPIPSYNIQAKCAPMQMQQMQYGAPPGAPASAKSMGFGSSITNSITNSARSMSSALSFAPQMSFGSLARGGSLSFLSAGAEGGTSDYDEEENEEEISDESMGMSLRLAVREQEQPRFKRTTARAAFSESDSDSTSDADAAAKLIFLQDFDGSWALTDELLRRFWSQSAGQVAGKLEISKLQTVAEKELPAPEIKDKALREKILVTCMVVLWFRHRLAGEKDTWELVAEKADDWLTANLGGNVDGCLAKAKEILGIA